MQKIPLLLMHNIPQIIILLALLGLVACILVYGMRTAPMVVDLSEVNPAKLRKAWDIEYLYESVQVMNANPDYYDHLGTKAIIENVERKLHKGHVDTGDPSGIWRDEKFYDNYPFPPS